MKQIAALEAKYTNKKKFDFAIGDTVEVYFKIKEENKFRIQLFTGVVIAIRGTGMGKSFTVRHISYGEGVERVFPYNSPLIDKITVQKKGKVRRAKLYYLRGQKGKNASKVKEKIDQKDEAGAAKA